MSIFWQPTRPLEPDVADKQIASALLHGGEEEKRLCFNYFSDLMSAKNPKSIFNFSAIAHETRHFDDILLTPWGNRIFAKYFFAVAQNLRLWRQIQLSGARRVRIPIQTQDMPSLENSIAAAKQACHSRSITMKLGIQCLEALAYWTQHQFVWATREEESQAYSYLDAVDREVEDARLITIIHSMGRKWGAPAEDFINLAYRLLVGCLSTKYPDSHLVSVLKILRPEKWGVAKKVLKEGVLPRLEHTPVVGVPFEDWFLSAVKRTILDDGLLSKNDKGMLLEISQDFLDVRRRLRLAIDDEEAHYRQFDKYCGNLITHEDNTARPGPRVYAHYPYNEALVFWGKSNNTPSDLHQVRTVQRASPRILRLLKAPAGVYGPVSVILLHPVSTFLRPRSVLSQIWGNFARDIVGCTMLVDSRSVRDPVHLCWWTAAREEGIDLQVVG